MDIRKRRQEVENQLSQLLRQVESMDTKIRAYLADRHSQPHPRHGDLVEKVRRFRIDPAISTKQLETMLDNLQWKVYYHNRAWNQLWENAEARRRNERQKEFAAEQKDTDAVKDSAGDSAEKSDRPVYSVDRLWEVQKEKLGSLGENREPEVKDEFVRRIKHRYGQLASEKKDNEEIYMTFDRERRRCTLEKRERKE